MANETYKKWVSGEMVLNKEACQRLEILRAAGIPLSRVVQNALAEYLAKKPADLLAALGLTGQLENPADIELPDYDYKRADEKRAA